MSSVGIRTTALAVGDVAVLGTLHPSWRAGADALAHPARRLAAGPDVALAQLCGVLLWLAAAWVALGLLAGLGTRLPGLAGRVCTRCVRVVAPRILVRVVVGTAGLGLLATPAAQALARPAPSPPGATSTVATRLATLVPGAPWVHASPWDAPGVPAPSWPVSPPANTPVAAPTWPSSEPSVSTPSPSTPSPSPSPSPSKLPTPTRTPAPRPSTRLIPASGSSSAHVRPGDSLWLLAARRLGGHPGAHDIAQYWPRIYTANQGVIGDDPSVIHAGQVLDLPAPTPQESP